MQALADRIGVKSVQSGIVIPTITYTKNSSTLSGEMQKEIEIPIDTVNPKKCLVLLSGIWASCGYTSIDAVPPLLSNITSENLVIKPASEVINAVRSNMNPTLEYGQSVTIATDVKINWQVIEFY